MKNTIKFLLFEKLVIIFFTGILLLMIFQSCTGTKFVPHAAYYSFEYKGEKYRIRSVYKDKQTSFNELISKKFVARDFDKDGFMDAVLLGQVSLVEAQNVYDFALKELSAQGKLRNVNFDVKAYNLVKNGYSNQIKSVYSDTKYFNVYKIIPIDDISNSDNYVAVDKDADGSIDEIVSGTMSVEVIQKQYKKIIKIGLDEGKLVQLDDMILVK